MEEHFYRDRLSNRYGIVDDSFFQYFLHPDFSSSVHHLRKRNRAIDYVLEMNDMTSAIVDKPHIEISFSTYPEKITQIIIETPRLRMESVTSEHIKDYEGLYGNSQVMEKFAAGETKDATYVKKRIESWTKRWENGDPFSGLAIYEKESGEFLGHIILGHGGKPGESELAFLFLPKFWNQGYGKEAVAAVIEELAPKLASLGVTIDGGRFQEIVATARVDSIASNLILSHHMTLVKQEEKYGALRNHYSRTIEQIEVPQDFWSRIQSCLSNIFEYEEPKSA